MVKKRCLAFLPRVPDHSFVPIYMYPNNANGQKISPLKLRAAMAGFFFVSGFGFSSFASRIPSLQQNLSLTDAGLGSLLFAMPLGLICTLPLTGFLLGKYQVRNVMLLGSIAYNLLLCSLGLVQNQWQLALALFFFGSSRNIMNISINALSVEVQTYFNRSIINSFHGIWSVSGFLGAGLGGWMIAHDGEMSMHFALVGAVCALAMALCFPNTVPNPIGSKRPGFHLPKGPLFRLGLLAFGCMACEGIMYDWSGIYFVKAVHAPKAFTSVGYVCFMCSAATARFLGDKAVDRFGKTQVLRACTASVVVGLLLAIVFPTVLVAGLGFMLVGIGVSCTVPLIMASASGASSKPPGIAIASVSTISYLGFLICPPMIGHLASAFGLRAAFGFGVVVALGMLALLKKKI